jgi:hypothetical protein
VRTAVINKRAGGMGLILGRKAFKKSMADGVKLINAVQDVYLTESDYRLNTRINNASLRQTGRDAHSILFLQIFSYGNHDSFPVDRRQST